MRLEIPEAHWQAIRERSTILQQMLAQFQLLRNEERRHTDAVIAAAGHKPDAYQNYELATADGKFYLDLTTKPPMQPPMQPPPVDKHVNGAMQPEV